VIAMTVIIAIATYTQAFDTASTCRPNITLRNTNGYKDD
jgi:hypothetical protein